VFAPNLLMTVATISLLALFLSLGRWQWQRGVDRQIVWDAFARNSGVAEPVSASDLSVAKLERFARVELSGRYDGARQFLLDNRSFEGRPGYEVLTPLQLADGRWLLVNRGWIAFSGFRDRLPDVSLPNNVAERAVRGRLDVLPTAGLARGRAAPPLQGAWPRVTSFPTEAELATAFGAPLISGQLLLDSDAPDGYGRAWRPPGLDPARHKSYAIQWWGFALVLLILYVGLNLKRRETLT
jgi:surfeit locus 1 family protein